MENQHVVYNTGSRVCAAEIHFDVINGRCHNLEFKGGCRGNTQGLGALAEGMPVEMVAQRLRGIPCHGGHSCPDELATAIEKMLQQDSEESTPQENQ